MRRAVIDIGTNSVKLLIAEVEGESVHPLWEGSEQTRLGEGFFEHHQLQPAAIHRTAQAVTRFAATAKSWNAASVRVIATSAARDATNRSDLLNAVSNQSGLQVEVISGQQEADWAFGGVRTDAALAGNALLIVDIGGGSTEFILGRGALPICRHSVLIGTVRMLEKIQPADPPVAKDWQKCQAWLTDLLESDVKPLFEPHLRDIPPEAVSLVGTGGTTTILAAMELGLSSFDRERIEQIVLPARRVWHYQKLLWSLPIAEREKLAGLPPNRADVILFGVAVVALVMEMFGLTQLHVSTRGLRFAAAATSPG